EFPEFVRTRSGLSHPLRRSLWGRLYPFSHTKEADGTSFGRDYRVGTSQEDIMSRMPWAYVALCMVTVMIPASPVRADVVLDWNAHAARAIVTIGRQIPPRALIRLAMVHLAIYDAVNAIEGVPFESYASVPNVDRPASAETAAAT